MLQSRLYLALYALVLGVLLVYLAGYGDFWNSFTADSYCCYLIGEGVFQHGVYGADTARELALPRDFPQSSRSFPPVLPLLLGLINAVFGAKIYGGLFLNLIVMVLTGWTIYRVLKRLHVAHPELLALVFPLFCFLSMDYTDEVTAGRTIPLVILFYWLFVEVALRLNENYTLKNALWGGALLGLLMLTRTDHTIFSALTPLLMGAFLYRKLGLKQTLQMTAVLYLAMFVVYLPWGVRNQLAFGSFFASDNSATATSLYNGRILFSAYWVPGQEPKTVKDAPVTWLIQRAGYLYNNLRTAFTVSNGLLLIVGVFAVVLRRNLSRAGWLLLALGYFHWLTTLAGISLTPYWVPRYFASGYLFAMVAALFLLSQTARQPRYFVVALFAMLFINTEFLLIPNKLVYGAHYTAQGLGLVSPREFGGFKLAKTGFLKMTGLKEITQKIVPEGARVGCTASTQEAVNYYTGYKTFPIPVNLKTPAEPAFALWLADWKPDFLFILKKDEEMVKYYRERNAVVLDCHPHPILVIDPKKAVVAPDSAAKALSE